MGNLLLHYDICEVISRNNHFRLVVLLLASGSATDQFPSGDVTHTVMFYVTSRPVGIVRAYASTTAAELAGDRLSLQRQLRTTRHSTQEAAATRWGLESVADLGWFFWFRGTPLIIVCAHASPASWALRGATPQIRARTGEHLIEKAWLRASARACQLAAAPMYARVFKRTVTLRCVHDAWIV